ncbi:MULTISPECIES: sulfurtransferase [Brevibacterium]|uniref:Sulfurtransferase n=1 Tax=Brevibacterium salitolerans TaxID=1403566 RepID=A0ABP5IJN8_9MICO|nr:sulfurtransferase [Brevibacterium sp.]
MSADSSSTEGRSLTDARSRAETRETVLVTVDELARLLGIKASSGGTGTEAANDAPVILDVRWNLMRPDGREEFEAGHIPGARYVSLDEELADHSSQDPTRGRHPLPSAEAFEATANAWGVRSARPAVPGAAGDAGEPASAGTPVVVYDDAGGQAAARAWWLLRWAGHTNVRVFDGGWPAWRDAGFPVETGPGAGPAEDGTGMGAGGQASAGGQVTGGADGESSATGTTGANPAGRTRTFTVHPGSMPVLTADEAAALAHDPSGVLLDARAPERYEGLAEPMDPVAGHIPGARNAPAGRNSENGHLRSAADLRAHYRALGVPVDAEADGTSAVGAYCGSGVSASHTVLALASLGVEAALFPGSWSAWSNDPARPVATGPEA